MRLTRNLPASDADPDITVPLLECWNPVSKVATIAAEVNKRRVLCRITLKILQDKFRASEDEPMRAVADNRSVIQGAARKLIEN